jgi:predicted metal-dependent hydrolase
MSFVFPEGERMFVRSVKWYSSEVRDPLLREQVGAFIGQEMHHGKTHEDMNQWLKTLSPAAAKLSVFLCDSIKRSSQRRQKSSPMMLLAETVALEHLTSALAASVLARPQLIQKMHPQLRPIVVWHSIEEIEHKTVAFDVYKAVGGGYFRRILALAFAGTVLPLLFTFGMLALLYEDRASLTWRSFREFLVAIFGPDGLIAGILPTYFAGFHPSFHPSQTEDLHLMTRWLVKLNEMTPVVTSERSKASIGA